MNANKSPSLLRFCWTRFGIESGESVDAILQRKERERLVHGGMFLWGIGNSVAPGMEELVRFESTPKVVFSPMRSKAKAIDVAPSRVITWTRATTLSGDEWDMPEALRVFSRAATASGLLKQSHYALVCSSSTPLQVAEGFGEIHFDKLVNLVSKNKLGHSQVTSVVECLPVNLVTGTSYPVGFVAELVYPYFIKLTEPEFVPRNDEPLQGSAIQARPTERQASLLPV